MITDFFEPMNWRMMSQDAKVKQGHSMPTFAFTFVTIFLTPVFSISYSNRMYFEILPRMVSMLTSSYVKMSMRMASLRPFL